MVKNDQSKIAREIIWCYFEEAIRAVVMDFAALMLVWFVYIKCIYPDFKSFTPILYFTLIYAGVTTILQYWTALCALFDILTGKTVVKTVSFTRLKTEASWCGWLWHSPIAKFYPEDQMVDRFKLSFLNEDGKKCFVRLVTSFRKRSLIFDTLLQDPGSMQVEIRYLPKSKILLDVALPKGKKYDEKLERQIFRLNRTL